MGEVEWEQVRREAERVIDYLELEENLQHSKRRWILKNWPEPKNLDKDEKHALGSLEKYILLSTFCCVALRSNVVDP